MKNSITVYGIKNCDTMKKAFAWLDRRKIAYAFHDYKKFGADEDVLKRAIDAYGWESVLNRKGTTWRGLPDKVKESMTDKRAFQFAVENPSVIKRPLVVCGKDILLGFDEADFGGKLG